MTRPERQPESDQEQQAYSALAELLSRAVLHRTTGKAILTIELNQGGVRAVRIGTEENFKQQP